MKQIKNDMKMNIYKFEAVEPPRFIEDRRKDYVTAGVDNLFFNKLIALSNEAAMHSAIVNKKVKMILGETILIDSPTPNANQEAFIASCNANGETLTQVIEKCAYDLTVSGMFYLQIIWANKATVKEIYHMPFQKMRSGKLNDNGKVDNYYFSDKWSQYTKDADIITIPIYSNTKDQGKPQILPSIEYRPGCTYYSLPSYIGGLLSIDTLVDIQNFHNACIKNSFAPNSLIIFRGPMPSEEAMAEINKKMKEKFAGSSNAGESVIFFLDGEQEVPTFETMTSSDLSERFDLLEKSVKENVILAHSIPRSVAGIESTSSMGNSSRNIIENEIYFYNSFIKYEQQFILNTINKVMTQNGWDNITIKNPSASLMLYSEALISQVLTTAEIRELFGYSASAQVPPTQPTNIN